MSYRELADRLGVIGWKEHREQAQPGLTAAFFIARMDAIGCKTLRLDE
jgi:hypothetical protein